MTSLGTSRGSMSAPAATAARNLLMTLLVLDNPDYRLGSLLKIRGRNS
jgi:hypothetical protein